MSDLKVGQKVWVRSYYRGESKISEATVSKIGRQYFYLEEYRNKFTIEDLREVSNFMPNRVYLDVQNYYDEVEYGKLLQEIRTSFNYHGGTQFSLSQLREIAKIIKLSEDGV